MALTPSTMAALGTPAPDFTLRDVVGGRDVSLSDFASASALLVIFLCRHCPYVQHVKDQLRRLGEDYAPPRAAIVAISSNDASCYPDDAPESLAAFAREEGFGFPLLYDENQEVAAAFTAACTPDFFLYDADRRLVYRGQLDESRPGNGKPVDGKDLRAAMQAVLAGVKPASSQKPSIGCNIKWKSGKEPAYFHP